MNRAAILPRSVPFSISAQIARTVFVAAVLLLSVAFLVGDSYNPFLYFRF